MTADFAADAAVDEALAAALRAPGLALSPPDDLVRRVERRARRVRRRQAGGAAVLVVLVAAGAGSLGTSRGDRPAQLAAPTTGPVTAQLFPAATSSVEPLAQLNGGTVYTWFQGGSWCTGSVRTGPPNTSCAGSLGASPVRPFAYVRGPEVESLRVDDDGVVAGLLGDGVAQVRLRYGDGRLATASTARAEGFRRPVWYAPVRAGERVVAYSAYAANGQVLARRTG